MSLLLVPKSSTEQARDAWGRGPSAFAPAPHVVHSSHDPTCLPRAANTPMVLSLNPSAEGVLPGHLLERAIRASYIEAGRFNIPESNVQPASLDLRLGERAL